MWISVLSIVLSCFACLLFIVFKSVYAVVASLGAGSELRSGLELALRLSAVYPLLSAASVCLGFVAVFCRGGIIAMLALVFGVAACGVPLSVL